MGSDQRAFTRERRRKRDQDRQPIIHKSGDVDGANRLTLAVITDGIWEMVKRTQAVY